MKILLALTEEMVERPLAVHLEYEGQVVETDPSGADVMHLLDHGHFDALVVDPTLPGDGGLALIRAVRKRGHRLPIVVLSRFDDVRHKCLCFEAGADDHMLLPFRSEELLARLKAIARRMAGHLTAVITFGAIRIDTAARRITVHGAPVHLTRTEFLIVEALVLRRGRPVSGETLYALTHREDCDSESKVIAVFMTRLRRKFAEVGAAVSIETQRLVGYRLVQAPAAPAASMVPPCRMAGAPT